MCRFVLIRPLPLKIPSCAPVGLFGKTSNAIASCCTASMKYISVVCRICRFLASGYQDKCPRVSYNLCRPSDTTPVHLPILQDNIPSYQEDLFLHTLPTIGCWVELFMNCFLTKTFFRFRCERRRFSTKLSE